MYLFDLGASRRLELVRVVSCQLLVAQEVLRRFSNQNNALWTFDHRALNTWPKRLHNEFLGKLCIFILLLVWGRLILDVWVWIIQLDSRSGFFELPHPKIYGGNFTRLLSRLVYCGKTLMSFSAINPLFFHESWLLYVKKLRWNVKWASLMAPLARWLHDSWLFFIFFFGQNFGSLFCKNLTLNCFFRLCRTLFWLDCQIFKIWLALVDFDIISLLMFRFLFLGINRRIFNLVLKNRYFFLFENCRLFTKINASFLTSNCW